MLAEFSKRKDGDRNKRMEALKNNDVDRYCEFLLEQQTSILDHTAQTYAIISSFLCQTEEYLFKLGGKIAATKNQQEAEDAAPASSCCTSSGEEVMIRNWFPEMNAPKDGSSVNEYYNLAHAVIERITKQPSMLCVGTLTDYQLADEMGHGTTVQVMALIAFFMAF
ncbi:hypothetical protein NE237_028020 [Protea cynaroides]|uniref:Uncharacterized protein n=1 Tax=Protea cynaroides TaxID=273540 RepID=A0A9Q0GR81_9MAGN|nr:hypothetical protein NE237_028020 [Protea cynaroides]